MLEYIESTGTQYIDTGITPTNNTKVEMMIELTSSNFYAAVNNGSSKRFGFYALTTGAIDMAFGSTGYKGSVLSGVVYPSVITIENGKLTAGEQTYTFTTQTAFNTGLTLTIFADRTGNGISTNTSGILYYCKIYENGILVRDYIPVLRSDGIAGLYDKVNDTFYASAGSSNFVASSESLEILAIQTSVTGTYKIPFGTSYTVKASDVASYVTPSLYGKTADSKTNVVTMQYVYNPDPGITTPTNGVWIQSTEGKYYTSDNWLSSKTPNGIAVITSNCRFVMALANAYSSYCTWGGYGTTVSGIVTTTAVGTAQGDYLGDSNTTQIISQLGASSAPAANYCRSYTFPNGATGYLGAAGEWQAALDNKSAIATALTACGGTAMSNYYWTSTQSNYQFSWCVVWDSETLSTDTKDGTMFGNNTSVRAFAAI